MVVMYTVATKVFDRLHFGRLSNKLLKRRMPVNLIRILFDSYARQKSRVAWGTYKSNYFCMNNGAKHLSHSIHWLY